MSIENCSLLTIENRTLSGRTLAGLRQIWLFPADIPAEGHY